MPREYKGTGALFKNQYKKEEKHPDYKGEVEMGGLKYELAGWVRESRKGDKYISVVIGDLKDNQGERLPEHPKDQDPSEDFSDVPF